MILWQQKNRFRRSNTTTNNNNGIGLLDLPDDIAINILSRLPVRCILNLKTVSKKWLALTSSLHFAETHFKSAQISEDNELDLFFLDEEAKRYKMVKIMSNGFVKVFASDISPMLVGSCNGLLVFKMFVGSRFLVWDLVTRESAFIDAPAVSSPSQSHDDLRLSAIIFLDDPQGGYKLLFSRNITINGRCEFLIYESSSRMWRNVAARSYPPLWWSVADAVVNPTIYKRWVLWMAAYYCDEVQDKVDKPLPCRESVVMFNMDVEEFRYMPHPNQEMCGHGRTHKDMYVFEEKGRLYYVRVYLCFPELELWSLEEEDRWLWSKRYTIKLDYLLNKIWAIYAPGNGPKFLRFIKIEDDVIYFQCCYRGLFMYDWKKRTVKKLDKKRRDYRYYFLGGRKYVFTYSDTSLSPESGFRSSRQGRIP